CRLNRHIREAPSNPGVPSRRSSQSTCRRRRRRRIPSSKCGRLLRSGNPEDPVAAPCAACPSIPFQEEEMRARALLCFVCCIAFAAPAQEREVTLDRGEASAPGLEVAGVRLSGFFVGSANYNSRIQMVPEF